MTAVPPNKRLIPTPSGQLVYMDHRCAAIVDNDSVEFARKLQEVLTANTQEGFTVQTMLNREKDQGLVLVFQRVSLMGTDDVVAGERTLATIPPVQGTRH
jgi:hypothetical protein